MSALHIIPRPPKQPEQRSRPPEADRAELDALHPRIAREQAPPGYACPQSYRDQVLLAYVLGGALANPSYREAVLALPAGLLAGVHADLLAAMAQGSSAEVARALEPFGVRWDGEGFAFPAVLDRAAELGRERLRRESAGRLREALAEPTLAGLRRALEREAAVLAAADEEQRKETA